MSPLVGIYISRDVVFDESVFPFESLHPNAGALLKNEILLLPPNLRNFEQGGDDCADQHEHTTSSSVASVPVQVHGENGVENDQNLAHSGPILHVLEEEQAGAEHEADLEQPATPARQASSRSMRRSSPDRVPSQPRTAVSPGSTRTPRPTCVRQLRSAHSPCAWE